MAMIKNLQFLWRARAVSSTMALAQCVLTISTMTNASNHFDLIKATFERGERNDGSEYPAKTAMWAALGAQRLCQSWRKLKTG